MTLRIFYMLVTFCAVSFCDSMEYVRTELSSEDTERIEKFASDVTQIRNRINSLDDSDSTSNMFEEVVSSVENKRNDLKREYSNKGLDDDVYNEEMRELDKAIYDLAKMYQKHGNLLDSEMKTRLRMLGIVVSD